VPRAAWHWGGDSSAVDDPLRAPGSIPLYLCLPLLRGSAGGDYYFPTTRGTLMEKTQIKKPIKSRDAVVQKDLPSCAQQGSSQSGKPLQGAGIPSKPRDIEHMTKVKDKWTQDVPKM
jgi:hypothetical protein